MSQAILMWARHHPVAFLTRLLICVAIGVSTFVGLCWLFLAAPKIIEQGVGIIVLVAIGFGAYRWGVGILFRVEPPA